MVNKRLKFLILIVSLIIILIGLSSILVYAACPHGVTIYEQDFDCGADDSICPEDYGADCCAADCPLVYDYNCGQRCTSGSTQNRGCGNCGTGTETRTCTSSCTWGSYGSCTGEGCSPGATQSQGCGNCGTQSRTCTSACAWPNYGSCTGEGCTPGATQSQGCGNCGTQSRTCTSACAWPATFGTCTGEGCSPTSTSCSGYDYLTCKSDCTWRNDGCVKGGCGVECCASSDCASGNYCRQSDYSCQDLPLCAEANAGYGYNAQEDNEDLWNDCSSSWNSCDSPCVRRGGDGACAGGSYACDTDDTTGSCAANNGCSGGSCSVTSEAGNCNDGVDNDCDGEWDYDTLDRGPAGNVPSHGDNNCQVGVTNIVVSNTTPYINTNINITCTVDVGIPVNSIFAYIDENANGVYNNGIDRDCGWPSGSSWLDNSRVRFVNCNIGSNGTKNAACGIYSSSSEPYDRSYQSGSDVTRSMTGGSCGDGTVNGPEECEGSDCKPGCINERCNASTCTWYSIPSENNCTDSIDNDCDCLFDGSDGNDCPEGSGNIISSPYRACNDNVSNDGWNDNPEVLIDIDDDGCCDLCLANPNYGFDTSAGHDQCGTPNCDCGSLIFNWEEPALMDEYCCGDDAGEFFTNTIIGSNTYYACCNESTDCVDANGSCQIGVEEYFELCTNGVDDDCDNLIDREDDTCQGAVTGYVFDEDGFPVIGALVKGSPAGFGTEYESNTTTGPFGEYTVIDALVGEYSFIARKEGYDDKVIPINVSYGKTAEVNFTIKNGSCHADCTDYYGNCNPACEGAEFSGGETCTFISELCYNRPKGFIVRDIVNGTVYEYICCEEEEEGPVRTYPTINATVTGDVENLYDYVMNVKFKGRYVRMHILVWKPKE